jgi:subtilisin family serine protease
VTLLVRPVPLNVVIVVIVAALAAPHMGELPPHGDPYLGAHWGLAAVNAPEAWDLTTGSRAVVVAVVDSGVDLTHQDLVPNLWSGNGQHGVSVARATGGLRGGHHAATMDDDGHGTLVAGVIAAVAENGRGGRGVAQVPLMVVKAYGVGAPGHVEALADGIRWAAENGARVISVSISAENHAALYPAVREAWCAGALIVASAGNEGGSAPRYPGAYDEVLAVGAIDRALNVWEDSNRGGDLYAPGVGILSTRLGNTYGTGTGTSVAAPFVSGAAALVLAANPALTNADVVAILKASARPLPGADAPLLDVGSAIRLALMSEPGPGPDCGPTS